MLKKILLALGLMMIILTIKAQDVFNLAAYKLYLFQIEKVISEKEAEFINRSTEKTGLSVFTITDIKNSRVYVFLSDENYFNDLGKYLNANGFKVVDTDDIEPNNNLFLELYCMRGNIDESKIQNQLPNFIQIGPYNNLSNQLYKLAKDTWISKYPEQYNSMFSVSKEINEEDIEKRKNLSK